MRSAKPLSWHQIQTERVRPDVDVAAFHRARLAQDQGGINLDQPVGKTHLAETPLKIVSIYCGYPIGVALASILGKAWQVRWGRPRHLRDCRTSGEISN